MNAHWFVFENISPKTFKIFKLDMAHSPIEAHSVNQQLRVYWLDPTKETWNTLPSLQAHPQQFKIFSTKYLVV